MTRVRKIIAHIFRSFNVVVGIIIIVITDAAAAVVVVLDVDIRKI